MLHLPLEIYKAIIQKYNAFEVYFCIPEKNQEKAEYLKRKNQNRLLVTFAILLMCMNLYFTSQYGTNPAIPILGIVSIFVGLKLRLYNALRYGIFIFLLFCPYLFINYSFFMIVPFLVFYTNSQVLLQTGSYSLMLLHVAINAVVMKCYAVDILREKIRKMTAEEAAESFSTAVYHCLFLIAAGMVVKYRFDGHVSKLLRRIRKLNEDLEGTNAQINAKNVQLHANLETKDLFIYTFSHELKNALNGLLGNLNFALEYNADSKVEAFLSSAKVCGEVVRNFIHNILDTGKLENGNLEVSLERKNVMTFFRDIWIICGQIISNKRLDGHLWIDKSVPKFLNFDGQRLLQIILNLVSNAVKFTEKGRVTILVDWQKKPDVEPRRKMVSLRTLGSQDTGLIQNLESTEEFDDLIGIGPLETESNKIQMDGHHKKFLFERRLHQLNCKKWDWSADETLDFNMPEGTAGMLRIQVIDTGCGMTPEEQSELFQKFSQVNSNPTQRKIGTGLGLWICKELTTRLEGEIHVRSTPRVGSVFEVKVRADVVELHSSVPTISRIKSTGVTTARINKQKMKSKILVIDDDGFNIELMNNFLTKLGIDAIYAYDGEEGVNKFKENYYEISMVATDNFMPKKTGTQAAMEISQFLSEKKMSPIPIVCISGDPKIDISDCGITAVIQKPINFAQLQKQISVVYPQINEN